MAVKRSQSATRMLQVFEAVAATQPQGVSALARKLGADKSAVQRDLMTLADAGWIRPAPGHAGQWELTPRILTFARPPHSTDALRQKARPVMEHLRRETGETAYLTVPEADHFVVVDALESFHMLRMGPPIGIVVPIAGSATARAVLPHLAPDEQVRLLGHAIAPELAGEFAATRAQGYAINDGDIQPGAVALASAILDGDGRPVGSLVVTGPAERLPPPRWAEVGQRLREAAWQLSG
ncbi:MAG: IclR family transcriptional regulator [Novosphingobium sp.]